MPTETVIGREREWRLMKEVYQSKQAEFLALYGRRRVGKTYLIEQFIRSSQANHFQLTGMKKATLAQQLNDFTQAFQSTFLANTSLELKAPKNWMAAFEQLTEHIKQQKNKKWILFFDELPWLASKKSGFLSALDYYWNTIWRKQSHLKLVVCGSSASWMINELINDKGGLHNRVTKIIQLLPFSLAETKQFFHAMGLKLNHQQILSIYLAFGGIPHYLREVRKRLSVTQNIQEMCFRQDGKLHDEFNRLFTALFEHSDRHYELVRLIASKHYGMSRSELEKQAKTSTSGGTLTTHLKELEASGFIKKFVSFGNQSKGYYYKVIDEYILFYLRWIDPVKNVVVDEQYWHEQSHTPAYFAWAGLAFESICYKHIQQLYRALNIPSGSIATAWRYVPKTGSVEEGAQVDLLFDRRDDAISLCEIKFSNKPFVVDKHYAKQLLNKQRMFVEKTRTKKQVFIAIIAANGLADNLYADDIVSASANLDDFFV